MTFLLLCFQDGGGGFFISAGGGGLHLGQIKISFFGLSPLHAHNHLISSCYIGVVF